MVTNRILFLCSILIGTFSSSCIAAQFSDSQQNAAVSAYMHRSHVQETFRACALDAGQNGVIFRFAEYFWQNDYLPITLAIEDIWPTLPDSKKNDVESSRIKNSKAFEESFKNANRGNRVNVCHTTLEGMEKGTLKFETIAPREAALLMSVYDADKKSRLIKRNGGFTSGCMKQIWNTGGRDFDKAKAICSCQTKAITDNASERELDEWVNDLAKNPGNASVTITDKAWMKRAISSAQSKCLPRP